MGEKKSQKKKPATTKPVKKTAKKQGTTQQKKGKPSNNPKPKTTIHTVTNDQSEVVTKDLEKAAPQPATTHELVPTPDATIDEPPVTVAESQEQHEKQVTNDVPPVTQGLEKAGHVTQESEKTVSEHRSTSEPDVPVKSV